MDPAPQPDAGVPFDQQSFDADMRMLSKELDDSFLLYREIGPDNQFAIMMETTTMLLATWMAPLDPEQTIPGGQSDMVRPLLQAVLDMGPAAPTHVELAGLPKGTRP